MLSTADPYPMGDRLTYKEVVRRVWLGLADVDLCGAELCSGSRSESEGVSVSLNSICRGVEMGPRLTRSESRILRCRRGVYSKRLTKAHLSISNLALRKPLVLRCSKTSKFNRRVRLPSSAGWPGR